jgi:hypothetical protein
MSWESDSGPGGQDIPPVLWDPKDHTMARPRDSPDGNLFTRHFLTPILILYFSWASRSCLFASGFPCRFSRHLQYYKHLKCLAQDSSSIRTERTEEEDLISASPLPTTFLFDDRCVIFHMVYTSITARSVAALGSYSCLAWMLVYPSV